MGAAEGSLGVCMGRIHLHTGNRRRANIERHAYLGREYVPEFGGGRWTWLS